MINYQAILDNLPYSLFLKDWEGYFIYANSNFCQDLGIPLEEILGRSDYDLHPQELSDKYRRDDQWVIEYDAVFSTIEEHEVIGQPKKIVQVVKTPLHNPAGKVIGVQGTFWDITGFQQQTQLYQSILESSLDGIISMDLSGKIVEWNSAAVKIFGYSQAEALGQPMSELIVPISLRQQHDESLAHYALTGQTSILGKRREVIGHHQEGHDFPIELTVIAVHPLNSQTLLTAFTRDLSERNQLIDQVKELDAFTYSVSHDLRAPLRAIDGFSKALDEDCSDQLNEEGRGYLQVIRDNTRKMGKLIDDLLAFSRLGKQPIQSKQIDMAKMVNQVCRELREATPHRVIQFTVSPIPDCQADPTLIRQVWTNLLANAVKFTQSRPIAQIEVGFQAGAYFVQDNGVGFDMKYADKLFGVFQRLHRAEDYEGTGVGLAIVQRILTKHGGQIQAQAEEDRGATFTFTINGEPHGRPHRNSVG